MSGEKRQAQHAACQESSSSCNCFWQRCDGSPGQRSAQSRGSGRGRRTSFLAAIHESKHSKRFLTGDFPPCLMLPAILCLICTPQPPQLCATSTFLTQKLYQQIFSALQVESTTELSRQQLSPTGKCSTPQKHHAVKHTSASLTMRLPGFHSRPQLPHEHFHSLEAGPSPAVP